MDMTHAPQLEWKDLARIAAPALIMPLVFSGVPGWLTDNADLLRLSWSVIAPSSLAGALFVTCMPGPRGWLALQMRRMPRVIVAILVASMISIATLILGLFAVVVAGMGIGVALNAAMSAGIGAAVATVTEISPNT